MKRIDITGLLVVIIIVLTAISASTAEAGEACYRVTAGETDGEFGNLGCTTAETGGPWILVRVPLDVRVPGSTDEYCAETQHTNAGDYSSLSNCVNNTGPAVGNWVRVLGRRFNGGGTAKKFTSTSGTGKLTAGSDSITCSKDTSAGEIAGEFTVGKLVVTFTGCTSSGTGGSGCAVRSVGAKNSGEIVTHTLKGELGEVASAEASTDVGLLLEPETTKKISLIEGNTCTVETTVTGSLAGEVSPVGSKQTTGKLTFLSTSGKRIQKINVLGTVKDPELEAFGALAGEETIETISYEEAVEVT